MKLDIANPSYAKQLYDGDLYGVSHAWPPNIKCYFSICNEKDLIAILCGGYVQTNVFGRYNGTNGEHVKAIINEIRYRERNKK